MSAPTMTVRITVSPEHGDLVPAEAMSLLLGVSAEEIRAYMTVSGTGLTTVSLPPEWLRSGLRRSKEAQAHGHTDMVGVMTYWAKRDHGAELVVEYAGATQ